MVVIDFKLYYRVIRLKVVQYRYRNGYIDKWNGVKWDFFIFGVGEIFLGVE